MRSSILDASMLLNVLIQHLPLQSFFCSKTWRACRASDPSNMGPPKNLEMHDLTTRVESNSCHKFSLFDTR